MSSEKIQVTTTPALPSKCAVCHTDAKGVTRFIDFGSDIDFYGAIVICEYCVVNAATTLGTLVPVARFNLTELNLNTAVDLLVAEKEKVKALEHLVAAYGFDRHLDLSVNSGADTPLQFGEADPEIIGDSDPATESSKSGSAQPATV